MKEREHYLVIAMEECNEVAQRISKAMRFSLEEIQPDMHGNPKQMSNQERIVEELNDLFAALEESLGVKIERLIDRDAINNKKAKMVRYICYANTRPSERTYPA